MRRVVVLAASVFLALAAAAGEPASARDLQGTVRFVALPHAFRAQCRSTARALGYPVPCPMRVPPAFARDNDGATPGCGKTLICPGPPGLWHRWAVGTSGSATQHLVITASPRPVNDVHVVSGPTWSPRERVRPLAWVRINEWRMHAVFASPATTFGAFMHHVVLIWTVGQHTYAVGFHNYTGIHRTLLLDEELARSIKLVGS